MKQWWCKRCFMPCSECYEDLWQLVKPNEDEFGEITSKTVDFRKKKEDKQLDD